MTRIETFVDAAFAFAFTMLVISIDAIPQSPEELLIAARDIPAFLLSATIIGSIWLAHSTWSRTFGLQDSRTIYLSLALVMLVLIFVYPIKLMVQSTVSFLSGERLGADIFNNGGWSATAVSDLFVFFGIGLIALSFIIICLYHNALRHSDNLVLTSYEKVYCKSTLLTWAIVAFTAFCSLSFALYAGSGSLVPLSGFIYFSLWVTIPLGDKYTGRRDFLAEEHSNSKTP